MKQQGLQGCIVSDIAKEAKLETGAPTVELLLQGSAEEAVSQL